MIKTHLSLVLVDGFLQYLLSKIIITKKNHNPYFNRWFSAITKIAVNSLYGVLCHNPYFSRWFSAI